MPGRAYPSIAGRKKSEKNAKMVIDQIVRNSYRAGVALRMSASNGAGGLKAMKVKGSFGCHSVVGASFGSRAGRTCLSVWGLRPTFQPIFHVLMNGGSRSNPAAAFTFLGYGRWISLS